MNIGVYDTVDNIDNNITNTWGTLHVYKHGN